MSTDTPRPGPRCKHIYPDGERCSLPADAHESVVGLADRHGYPPAGSPSTPRPERVTLSDEEIAHIRSARWPDGRRDLTPAEANECVLAAIGDVVAAREQALREGHKRIGRLHEALTLSGMTPSALAETVGMPLASLQNVLYLRRPPSATELVAFANALGVDPHWLHAGDAARIARGETR